jgi:hypothetical protein
MGFRYLLLGLAFFALLVVGSCSLMTYTAVQVAEKAVDAGVDKTDEALSGFEQAIHEQAEREREEQLFGKNPTQETYSDSQSE